MKNTIYTPKFILLSASSLFFFMSFFMIIPELPAYLESMGGKEYLGWIVALFAMSAGLSRPFSGRLADKIGRKPVMVVGGLICILLGFLYPLVGTVFGFLLLRFVHGFSAGFNPTGTVAYLADIVPASRRGEAMGIFGLVNNVGTSIGPVVGSAIANHFGVNAMFYISAIAGLVATLVLIVVKETLPNPQKFKFSYLRLKRDEIFEPRVKFPAILMLLTVFCFGAALTLVPDYSVHLGIQNKGLFFTFLTVTSVLVRFVSGKLSDRFTRSSVMMAGTIFLTLAMLMIAFAQGKFMFMASAVLFGLATGTNSPTLFAWAIDLSDQKNVGKGVATLFIALEAGIALGALLPAYLYQNDPSRLPLAFYACAAISFVAFFLLVARYFRRTMSENKRFRTGTAR